MRFATSAAAFAGLVFSFASYGQSAGGKPHFVDGNKGAPLLRQVVRSAQPKPSFNRVYSQSFVACGTGCGSYWFYDRSTGAIIETPDESRDDESISDVRTTISSPIVTIIYGPRDGVGSNCSARRYRMVGYKFQPVGGRTSTPCPS